MAKEGYTKSGKSLKAVRRYYALQAAKKGAKTPDDDKLSKRIAVELKTQQEANQRRATSPVDALQILGAAGKPDDGGAKAAAGFGEVPTERSALPEGIVMSQKQTGPIFLTADGQISKKTAGISPTKSLKSSLKSNRGSGGPTVRFVEGERHLGNESTFEHYSLGGLMTIALLFLITLLHTFVANPNANYRPVWKQELDFEVKWLGYTSIVVLMSALYWVYLRNHFCHAISSLILMILPVVSTVVLVASSRYYAKDGSSELKNKSVFDVDVHLVFILIISYLLLQLLTIALMIMHTIGLLSRQVERSARADYAEAGMSNLMSPVHQNS